MTLDYIITLDYRENEPFTRPGERDGGGEGRVGVGEEGFGLVTYSMWLVGAVVMTSSTFRSLSSFRASAEAGVQVLFTEVDASLPVSLSLSVSRPRPGPSRNSPSPASSLWAQTSGEVSLI